MPSPLPYFAFWARDWLSSSGTRDMSLAARGAYIDLLSYQWEDGDIPDSVAVLARRLGVSVSELEAIWPEIRACFEDIGGGRIRNQRLHEARASCLMACERNRENGARGGRPKNPDETETKPKRNRSVISGLSQTEPVGSESVNPNESQTEPNQKRPHNPNETETKPIPEPDTELDSLQEVVGTTQGLGDSRVGDGGTGEGATGSPTVSVGSLVPKSSGEFSNSGMVRLGELATVADPVFDDHERRRQDPDAVCDALSDPRRFRCEDGGDEFVDPPFRDDADDDTRLSRAEQIRRLKRGAA